ncbi:MAG: hypothetical protein EAX90_04800 [Candidatus Heimdallarchaeota archaeon]|nr:hypothetical protein [Candidatus Heimdallarchaeota archaeon]
MGYEMTRPSQKWLGVGAVAIAFFLLIFTLAVPYVNHFGEEGSYFSYFTKWSGRWRSDNLPPNTFGSVDELLNFPISASVLIGIGLLISIIGSVYLFWLTYSNKPCYFARERPGPVGGATIFLGIVLYIIGSFIYEKWIFGSPRPAEGWPGDKDFVSTTVRISPTFWIGLVAAFLLMAIATTSVIYYLDTLDKRPVK